MNISDEDILRSTEIVLNLEAINAVYVELWSEFLITRIKVKSKGAGVELVGQIYAYKEELHDTHTTCRTETTIQKSD